MRRLRTLALVLAVLLPGAAAAAAEPAVDAPAGVVRGVQDRDLRVFRGIPYAEPPVGERRWRAPAPLTRWEGTRDATRFGAACMQPKPQAPSIYGWDLPAMSEDCLSLNIWAPQDARGAPVFVWIHGGALASGSGADPIYDGSALARRGIVVVSINYRLGMFGWFAHPGLSAESPDHVSGNYGLLDQIAALEWVKRNIGAFGGNAGNVTIAGESAGALSVMYLMAAPQARGLFHKAIVQSGGGWLPATPLKTAYERSAATATALGLSAPDAAALRAVARPLPHYGSQSWLVFDGPRASARGVWEAPGRVVAVEP